LNKLAVLAFALLLFFSTMLWYLANGSLNEYLKSQVLLQSNYYSGQQAQLLKATYSAENGSTQFDDFLLNNIDGLSQPLFLSIDKITAQLAQIPSSQLNSPSIQKKTTTVVHVQKVTIDHLTAWSEIDFSGKSNLDTLLMKVNSQLATDYPALYANISAKMYAQKHPELNAELIENDSKKVSPVLLDDDLKSGKEKSVIERNPAIIASKEAKQKKRLLGKALTRIKVSSLTITELSLITTIDNQTVTQHFENIDLGSFGDDNGLDSNQLGGEILRRLLDRLISIEGESDTDKMVNDVN
jgi:hypothetical protein